MIDGTWHVFHLQSLRANSTQAEQTSPPPAQKIYLVKEVAHLGLLKKIHFALKPGEPTRSLPLADELREELKHSAMLSTERKTCSPSFRVFFFFPHS